VRSLSTCSCTCTRPTRTAHRKHCAQQAPRTSPLVRLASPQDQRHRRLRRRRVHVGPVRQPKQGLFATRDPLGLCAEHAARVAAGFVAALLLDQLRAAGLAPRPARPSGHMGRVQAAQRPPCAVAKRAACLHVRRRGPLLRLHARARLSAVLRRDERPRAGRVQHLMRRRLECVRRLPPASRASPCA
jgi:hypothetical protein